MSREEESHLVDFRDERISLKWPREEPTSALRHLADRNVLLISIAHTLPSGKFDVVDPL